MQTEYILKAMDAALAAGKEILNVYNDPSSDFQVERKADNSPLTLADRKAHETIMTYLQETDYPVLSEEGKHLPYEKRAQWDTLWIVDPLDGTKEFIKRNGEMRRPLKRIQSMNFLSSTFASMLKLKKILAWTKKHANGSVNWKMEMRKPSLSGNGSVMKV